MIRARAVAWCGLALAPGLGVRAAAAQTVVSGFARMSVVEHRVDAGYGVERFSGPALGLEGALRWGPRLTLGIVAQGAQLSPAAAGDLDRRVGEIAGEARVSVAPWLAFYGGPTVRAVATDAARQRWVLMRVGADVRPAFTGDRVRAIGRVGVMPVVAVNGLPPAALALDASVGLEYNKGTVTVGAAYALERFDFATRGGIRRVEQGSTLTLRAGIRLRGVEQ